MKKSVFLMIIVLLFTIKGISQNNAARFFKTFSNNGAWCWISDPRSVFINGKIYSGWVTSDGSIMAASYNQNTGETKEVNLYPKFEKDDHDNPSFLILPDRRLMVFFSSHSKPSKAEKRPVILYTITKNPEDITQWEPLKRITSNTNGPGGFCYTNPVMLSEENNRIYLFFRGGNWKPNFIYSDDFGKSWSKVYSLVFSSTRHSNRPYMKIASNGKDEIHLAFTDGHPRDEPLNSIYYLKYKGGNFLKADNSVVGNIDSLPLQVKNSDLVYNAVSYYKSRSFGKRAWIWDISVSKEDKPVISYTKLPTESEHEYWYAKWNGKEWKESKVSNAGAWFPRYIKTKSMREPEPHYSGGISIDPENTNIVYYAKPVGDIFEIFKSEIDKDGKWMETIITSQSKKDNVRPHCIKGADESSEAQVLWMFIKRYSEYVDYNTSILLDITKKPFNNEIKKESIKNVMKAVADWQRNEKLHHHYADWTNGALYAGYVEWAKLAARDGDSSYLDYLIDKGDKIHWAPLLRTNPDYRYNADDYAIGQMFVEMYRLYGEKKMIQTLERYFNFILKHPSTRDLKFNWESGNYPTERWSWCDALFMGPTVWAKMSNELKRTDYLEFMHNEFTKTYEYLYDKKEHLFYRDDNYFTKRESNGSKVFWGRGNGWVIAGLPTIINEVPVNWDGKKFYENLFIEMATKIATLQDKKGYWHASMLDPDSYPNPETSSSSFFTYALAWGINNGYLDKKMYQPNVEKGWRALVEAVFPDGKLGWVQPIGANPKKVDKEMTEVYGVGAFLLAGSEILKMIK